MNILENLYSQYPLGQGAFVVLFFRVYDTTPEENGEYPSMSFISKFETIKMSKLATKTEANNISKCINSKATYGES